MATYDLSGIGTQALSGGTISLFVLVTTFPAGISTGRANPTNYFEVGLLRFGGMGYFLPVIPIDAQQQLLILPNNVDTLGYSIFGEGVVRVTENAPAPPPGAFVSTSVDLLAPHFGDTITISWGGLGSEAAVDDILVIVQGGYPADPAHSIVNSDGFVYCSSGTDVIGSAPVSDGSASVVLTDNGYGTGNYAAYVVGGDGTVKVYPSHGFNVVS